MRRVCDAERRAIVLLLRSGFSCGQIGRAMRRSPQTIATIAREGGLDMTQLVEERTRRNLDTAYARAKALVNDMHEPGDLLALTAALRDVGRRSKPAAPVWASVQNAAAE